MSLICFSCKLTVVKITKYVHAEHATTQTCCNLQKSMHGDAKGCLHSLALSTHALVLHLHATHCISASCVRLHMAQIRPTVNGHPSRVCAIHHEHETAQHDTGFLLPQGVLP